LLSISDPWTDEHLKQWHGYSSMWYFDEDGHHVTDPASAQKSREMIPLAIYSLDYPTAPLLLVNFRSEWKPKGREIALRTADCIATGILGFTGPFANIEYYAAKTSIQWFRERRGSAVDRGSRLDAYAQFRYALLLDDQMDPALKKEVTSRLDQLAINPFEQSFQTETELARRQYAALLRYVQEPDGLARRIARERAHELTAFSHGPKTRTLLRLSTVATLGMYRHSEAINPESLDRLERERRIQARVQFLNRVLASSPRVDVVWNTTEIRDNLNELAALEAGRNDPAVSRLVAQIFARTSDDETRRDCLRCLSILNSAPARRELARISGDESVDLQLRAASYSYLNGPPAPSKPVQAVATLAGAGQ